MTFIPTIRCRRMQASLAFYTRVLGFELLGVSPDEGDPAFAVLTYESEELYLSSHEGDGAFGQALGILADDLDELVERLKGRGLDTSAKPGSPVHQAPTEQSWGTREFYVDDPDGNTLRFIEREAEDAVGQIDPDLDLSQFDLGDLTEGDEHDPQ